MANRKIAEVFPPGEFIKDELDERGWSQADFADIIGRDENVVSHLVNNKRSVTADIAKLLGDAFGTGAEFWMNLQNYFDLHTSKQVDDTVARKARLYTIAPIGDMLKRRWIEPSNDIEILESQVRQHFNTDDLEKPVKFLCAARMSSREPTPAHIAWFFRARRLAQLVNAKAFSDNALAKALAELKSLLPDTDGVKHVPEILAKAGIRFVIVEHLPKTGLDGVAFWLDSRSPGIAMSLRYDRIDYFWFTLLHELGHIGRRDGLRNTVILDTELVGEDLTVGDKTDAEKQACEFASRFLVDQEELDIFIKQQHRHFRRQAIVTFANKVKTHPSVVVGQLQYRRHETGVQFSHFREMLSKVRETVIASTITDGWGHLPAQLH